MSHSSLAIANEFIRQAQGSALLTPQKLQKLVYLAHGWNLSACGKPLIEDNIEAWKFGPVIRRLHDALIHTEYPIARYIRWKDDATAFTKAQENAHADLAQNEINMVELVWEEYHQYPSYQLSALTHGKGTPWSQVFELGKNKVIDNKIISDYFYKNIIA